MKGAGSMRSVRGGSDERERSRTAANRRRLVSSASEGEREPDEMRVAPDGTVRLPLAGGGVLEVATSPRLDLVRLSGPRRAFLSPETGRRGPFVAIVEGVPPAVADLFYSHARDELERTAAVPGSSLNRAVRAGCAAVRSAARRRPDLDAFGFTVVLFESAPDPVAFVAQLPPCQLYLVEGPEVRAVPEVPTGQASGRARSVAERRWEVEIETVRVPLVHDSKLVLVDASNPGALPDPARLTELARSQVGVIATRVLGNSTEREAVVLRFSRPAASVTGMVRASERFRDLLRVVGDRTTLATRLFGLGSQTDQRPGSLPHDPSEDPELLEALLEMEATGRVAASAWNLRDGDSITGTHGPDSGTSRAPVRGDQVLAMGSAPFGRGRQTPQVERRSYREQPPAQSGMGLRLGESNSIGVRRRATAPGGLPGQTGTAGSPWLLPARGSLVPTTFSGTPLDSARYPSAADPRGWFSRMVGPTVFLPGPRRRGQPLWLRGTVGALIAATAFGVLWAVIRPDSADRLILAFAPPTSTATPLPPSPTPPVLAGRTVAQARGRFTSLAAPPNVAGDQLPTANAQVVVLDDAGDVVTIALATAEVTREPVPTQLARGTSPPGFVARGFFADGGAVVHRDDGKLVFSAGGVIALIPSNGQPPRAIGVKGQPQWGTPVAAVIYGASMYVFDAGMASTAAPSGRVWRHPLTAGGNYEGDPVAWLAAGQTIDLTLASDVATDGAFWVSRRDGVIVRLSAGKADILSLKGAPMPTRLGAIYTDQGTQSLYVVDEASLRLIRIGKDGTIGPGIDSVLSPGEAVRGLWVDEDARTAVVVTTTRVAVVSLPV